VNLKIINAEEKDFLDVYKFVSDCKPLENYSEHFYKIILRYFRNTCLLAKINEEIVGFVYCFKSQVDKNKLFLWQIGVSSKYRNKKIAKKLIDRIEIIAKDIGCKIIELTVDPENIPSQNFFKNNGYINVSSKEGKTIKIIEIFYCRIIHNFYCFSFF
jgi:L-2,4-diaminobutyric acid acetyltransferase